MTISPLLSPGNARLMRQATSASIIVAIVLIVLKGVAWALTDSLSLLSSLVDSLMDVFASAINFMAVRYAMKPPDEDHRFGHTSVEDIAALLQGAFIAGSAAFITIEALARLAKQETVSVGPVGIEVMVISLVLTCGLVVFQRRVVAKTKSPVVVADALHYFSDILTNVAVLLALLLTWWKDWQWVDPMLALLISAYIFHSSWKVGKAGFDRLMDKEFSDAERETITQLVTGHAEVRGMHDLKTRRSGLKPFIQFHLELDGTMPLTRAHAISEAIEQALQTKFPGAEVIIHEDPEHLYAC